MKQMGKWLLVIVLLLLMFMVFSSFIAEAAEYTIQGGDMSLWCVAQDLDIDFWSLVLANNGPGLDPDMIHVGDVISLP